jgi:hypothetical protein
MLVSSGEHNTRMRRHFHQPNLFFIRRRACGA